MIMLAEENDHHTTRDKQGVICFVEVCPVSMRYATFAYRKRLGIDSIVRHLSDLRDYVPSNRRRFPATLLKDTMV